MKIYRTNTGTEIGHNHLVIINKNSKYDAHYMTTVSVLIKARTDKYSMMQKAI